MALTSRFGYATAPTGEGAAGCRRKESAMSEYSAWFECINGCPTRFSLFEVIYRCPTCGDLLDVVHDTTSLKKRSPAAWMQLFDERYRRNDFPYGSGVWGKKEWVVPFLDNENVVSTYEGGTNLLWAERYGRMLGVEDLWVKQCGNSHTGSFKDLGMTVLVSVVKQMIAEGKNIAAIACASTGDTSAALANYCAAAGIPAVVLLPRNKVSPAQLVQPLANGALVLSLDTDFDGCMALVQEITKEKTVYLANSMNSLRLEGQKTVAIELVQQFNWEVPDWVVIPGGNLGNVSALGKGFLLMRDLGLIQKLPRIAVAQAENANPLYLSYLRHFESFTPVQAKKTLASAIQIGNPVSYKRAVLTLKEFDGIVEQASESELADESARADRTGMFNCPHTGVALAVFRKLVERKIIRSNQRVVVISTAHGLKFAEQKTAYHLGQIAGLSSTYANRPVEIAADLGKVTDTIKRFAEKIKLMEA
jgi:threonine synthase